MTIRIHKIHWPKERNSYGKDLDFSITDIDCYVERAGHKCAKWAIGEAWYRVSSWFESKGATVTLGEPKEVEDEKQNKKQ